MVEQTAAIGMLMSLLIGLILFGVIMGVGALTLNQVQNVSQAMFIGDTWAFCTQYNTTHLGASTCGAIANDTVPQWEGNVTAAADGPAVVPSLNINKSMIDGNPLTVMMCTNSTGKDVTCQNVQIYQVNSTAYERGQAASLQIALNWSIGHQENYTVALPAACIQANMAINVTKNFTTTTLSYYCNTTGPNTWQLITSYTNATVTKSSYPAPGAEWITWQLYRGKDYVSGGSAATFAPITSSLDASAAAGSWLSTVVVVVIAGAIISMLVLGFRVFGGAFREGEV